MASHALPVVAPARLSRARFVVTVFVGSFLLFLVQPMVARMALPRLGGAPSVWNSAMLVYQALLLGGYGYAHLLGRLAPRRQAIVHLALFGLAALTLPISLIGATPPPDANVFIWVPWLLVVSIGPLFLVVSAQAPLIQRWFALSGEGDPYPLYAASNLGSFLGLIAYPLLAEPLLAVASQRLLWSIGFGLLALLAASCALRLPAAAPTALAKAAATAKPGRRAILRWIGFATIPSGLMLSTTLHLTTDIVAMPLLWVVPLGLYLLSYSVAFASNRGPAQLITRLAPFALLFAACSVFADSTPAPLLIAFTALGTLFVVAVALHARLFDERPDPAHLTTFYLSTSVGGVLGGLLGALIAPLTFDWTYEHPLLLAAAALAIPLTNPFSGLSALWDNSPRAHRRAGVLGLTATLASLVAIHAFGFAASPPVVFVAALVIIAIAIAAIGNRWLFALALAALMLSLGGWDKLALSASHRLTRSFFGIYAVRDTPDSRMLVHGTTTHGIENLGSAARERMLTTYYAPRSGVALALAATPAIFPAARVGIVGLGAGTLACASQPGQSWRFYEIDPKVEAIAKDTRSFRFLARCQPAASIVIGDARLMLEREPSASADVLVVDAFSSDSVPIHLLTLEAFAVYRRHLAANGLLMVHISNRYLDLRPVVAAAAAHGWNARIRIYYPPKAEAALHATGSMWVMMSPSSATLAKVEQASGADRWTALPTTRSAAWTDDYASILPIIDWGG